MTVQAAEEFGELLRICQRGCRTGAAELIATVKTLQTSQELAPKDAAEDLHR